MRTISSPFSGPARMLSQSRRILKCEPVAGPFFVLGLVLLLAGAAMADIECEDSYDVGEPIVVAVMPTGVPEGARLRGSFAVDGGRYWQPDANKAEFGVWPGSGVSSIKLSASGVWVLTQELDVNGQKVPILVDFGQYSFAKTVKIVGREDDDPVPPPVPEGTRWAVIWEETEQRDQHPGIGNLFLQLRKEFRDERLQIHDVTNLPPSLRALESQRPPSLPLPVLAVFVRQKDGTDKLVRHAPLPSSVDAVKAEIAK